MVLEGPVWAHRVAWGNIISAYSTPDRSEPITQDAAETMLMPGNTLLDGG